MVGILPLYFPSQCLLADAQASSRVQIERRHKKRPDKDSGPHSCDDGMEHQLVGLAIKAATLSWDTGGVLFPIAVMLMTLPPSSNLISVTSLK